MLATILPSICIGRLICFESMLYDINILQRIGNEHTIATLSTRLNILKASTMRKILFSFLLSVFAMSAWALTIQNNASCNAEVVLIAYDAACNTTCTTTVCIPAGASATVTLPGTCTRWEECTVDLHDNPGAATVCANNCTNGSAHVWAPGNCAGWSSTPGNGNDVCTTCGTGAFSATWTATGITIT